MLATVLSISGVFFTQDILYPLSNNPKIDKVSILLYQPRPGRAPPPPHTHTTTVINWTLQTIGEGLITHIFPIALPKQSWFDVR